MLLYLRTGLIRNGQKADESFKGSKKQHFFDKMLGIAGVIRRQYHIPVLFHRNRIKSAFANFVRAVNETSAFYI